MKVSLGKLGCLLAALAIGSASPADTLDPSLFQASGVLKVAGYQGAAALADFPVLVRLKAGCPAGFAYADAGTDGAGLRFADAEGNLLAHEIDTWNTSGESTVWVKLSALTNGALVRVYWKAGEAALPAVAASDVWTKYLAVLHGADYANAAASGLACAAGDTTAGKTDVPLVCGAAYDIAQNKMGVQIANPIKNGKTTTTDGVTISAWFRPTKLDAQGYNLALGSSNPSWNSGGFLWLWERCLAVSVAIGGVHQEAALAATRITDLYAWEHMAFSYGGTDLAIYENGAAVYANAAAKEFVDCGADNWVIGSYTKQTVDCFIGQMDEIRFYKGIAPADWLKAEYDAVHDKLFLVEAQAVPADAFGATAYLKPVGYTGAETLCGFPVPVRIRADFPKGFAYTDVTDPATDIRFFDMAGHLLHHEVDTWNTAGESLVWVRLNTLPTGGDLFRMGWKRNTAATLAANEPSAVWTKYLAVLHGSSYDNAAPSGLVCSPGATTACDPNGKLGGTAYTKGQNTLGLLVQNPVKYAALQLSADDGMTFSGWVYPTKTDASYGNVALVCNQTFWNKGGFLALWGVYNWFSVAEGGTHQYTDDGTSAIRKDEWQHMAFSYAGTHLAIYDDALQVYQNRTALYFADAALENWVVGSYVTQTVDSFIGQMDEIRFYRGIASADWVKADYASGADTNFVAEVDSSTPVQAVWTNAGAPGRIDDPANWLCNNSFGDVLANALPTVEATVATVAGETSFTVAAGATPNWKRLVVSNAVLTNACDWTALGGNYEVDGTLDLNGFDLRVSDGPSAGTITDTKGGASLIFDVPAGATAGNGTTAFTGKLKFIKEGTGTYKPTAVTQTYTGGTEIRAGIAVNAASGIAAYGPAKSTLKVCKGASFDWNTEQGVSYSFDIAGTGFEGKGAIFMSVGLVMGANWWQVNCIGDLTLSDDATIDSSNGAIPIMYATDNAAPHEITFNGHTLTFASTGTIWQTRTFLRGIKAMDAGTIVIEGAGAVFYAVETDLSLATLELHSGTFFSNEGKVTVGTFVDRRTGPNENASSQHQTIYVASCLKACSLAPYENLCLGTETAKEVTLDLSQLNDVFSTTLASPARSLTFTAGTTVTVDPGTRLPAWGQQSLPVVSWSAIPEDVTFVLPDELKGRAYRLDVRESGLYLSCDGMMILIR